MAEGQRGFKGWPLAQIVRCFSLLIGGRRQGKKQVREQVTHGTGEEDAHVNVHAWINAAQKPASHKPRQDNLFVVLTVAVDDPRVITQSLGALTRVISLRMSTSLVNVTRRRSSGSI